VVTVPVGEDTQEAQQPPQNNDHDNDHEEEEREEGNKAEGEDDEDYTPFHDTNEIKTTENEALIPTGRLRDLLSHLNITTHLEFRIKRVLCPGREEYKAIVESLGGGLLRDCGHGTGRRRHTRSSTAAAEQRSRQ
jgi:hypothetical protein